MPIITFGIATRIQNQERERFLHKLINSIQKQTRSEREIILSDDNSSINVDYSEYSKDKRIKIFHQKESLGIFGNFNFCLYNAGSERFIPVGDDDIIHTNFVEIFIDILTRKEYKNCEGFCFSYNSIDSRDRIFNSSIVHNNSIPKGINNLNYIIKTILSGKNQIMCFCSIINTKVLKDIGGYPDYGLTTDLYLNFSFPIHFNLGYISENLLSIRRHENNASGVKNIINIKFNVLENIKRIKKEYFALLDSENKKLFNKLYNSSIQDHICLMIKFQTKGRLHGIKEFIKTKAKNIRHIVVLILGLVFGKKVYKYFIMFISIIYKIKYILLSK